MEFWIDLAGGPTVAENSDPAALVPEGKRSESHHHHSRLPFLTVEAQDAFSPISNTVIART